MSTFISIDDGRSRISSSGTSQGARHRHLLALMVGTPGSLARHLPGGPLSTFFTLMVGALGSLLSPIRGPAINVSLR
jgi:hypothetical protein